MRYRVLAVIFVTWLLLGGGRAASAHELVQDTLGQTNAVLHYDPDDNPVAGETTVIHYDIEKAADLTAAQAKITIGASDAGKRVTIPATIKENAVAASYIFPSKGLYVLTLTISYNDASGRVISYNSTQSVSAGREALPVTSASPLYWFAGPTLALAALLVIYIRQRNQSKSS